MSALGVVIPHGEVPGWPPSSKEKDPVAYETVTFRDALNTRYKTDAWYQPVSIPEADGHQPRVNKAALAETKEVYLTSVFLDYDLPGHRAWVSVNEEIEQCGALFEGLLAVGLDRPAVYGTEHGCRVCWPLRVPIRADLADSWLEHFKAYVASQFTPDVLVLDTLAVGWNRCYRLPHVIREGTYWVPHYAQLHSFEPLVWAPNESLHTETPRAAVVTDGDAPEIRELTEKEWLHIPAFFRDKLQTKQALFDQGNRNGGTLNQVLPALSGTISNYAPPDPEIVYLALAPCVIAQGCEPPLDRLWERCYAMCTNDAKDYQLLAGLNAALPQDVFEALDEAKRLERRASEPESTKGDKKAAEVARRRYEKLVKALDEDREAAKRKAELADVAEAAKSDPQRPWLVYTGDSRSAFLLYPSDGRYHPKPKDTIATYIEREHGANLRSDKGALYNFATVFDMMGADAHEMVMRYWLPGAEEYYDAVTRKLCKTTTPPARTPQPIFHPDIAEWLRLLCANEEDHALLLDWLWGSLQLDKPIAAVFLCGPPGTGKSMLCEAVASFWGPKGDYNKTVGQTFNEALAQSPVLVADDSMKLSDDSAVEYFKELITSRYHSVNIKYAVPFYMEGCARVMFNGNSIDSLQLPASGGSDHNRAVAERLIFIECSGAPLGYLAKTSTEGWVRQLDGSPGKIAEHVLWLRMHHQRTTRPGRLLVSGDPDSNWLTRRAAMSDTLAGAVLMAIAKWADKRSNHSIGIGIDPEKYPDLVLVNADSLRDVWMETTLDRTTPSARKLAKAIASVSQWPSSKVVSIGRWRKRCHAIKVEAVLDAAEASGIGSDDELRSFLSGETLQVANTSRNV